MKVWRVTTSVYSFSLKNVEATKKYKHLGQHEGRNIIYQDLDMLLSLLSIF